jgi:hypothetical protein
VSDYPVTVNLTTRSGASRDLSITWTEGGEPVDLTGWSARLQVRTAVTSPTVLVDLESPDEILLGGTDGTIWAGLTPTHTAALDPGVYRYDLRLTDGGPTVVYLIEGSLKVKDPVTRP